MAIPLQSMPVNLPAEQRPMGAPVVHAPGLPSMEKVGGVKTVTRNTALRLMTIDAVTGTRDERLMAPVQGMSELPPTPGAGPQQPKEGQTVPAQPESYVRLEVRFENGRLSVISAKDVPGPLVLPAAVIQGHVYEVLIGDQQIALGSLPDVGLRRAFANRDVPGPEGKHRFIQVPTFDFFVRIPRAHVTEENLAKMTIILHTVQEAPERLTPGVALAQQPGIQTTEVARVPGIDLQQVPAEVRSQLEAVIHGNKAGR